MTLQHSVEPYTLMGAAEREEWKAAAKVLERAQEALKLFGWHQGEAFDSETGHICGETALALAGGQGYLAEAEDGSWEFMPYLRPRLFYANLHPGSPFGYSGEPEVRTAHLMLDAMILNVSKGYTRDLPSYNDDVAKSADEVIAVFEASRVECEKLAA